MQDLPFEEIPAESRSASPQTLRSLPFSPDHRQSSTGSIAGGPVLNRWEGPERRLRGLAPSSGLVSRGVVANFARSVPSWASFLFKVRLRTTGASAPPSFRRTVQDSLTSSVSHPAGTERFTKVNVVFREGTFAHRGERGGYRARGAGSWPPSARSEDRGWSRARRSAAEAVLERGIASGEAAEADPESHPRPNPFDGSPRVHARTAELLLPASWRLRPFHLRLRGVESGRPRCHRSLSGAEVASVGPKRFPAASRRSRRPS
jgi:hypothetical protein